MICQGTTNLGKRCKRKAERFCCLHDTARCNSCKLTNLVKESLILGCGHVYCKNCLEVDIYNCQWFEGFSTDDPLLCPRCDYEYSDSEWQEMMDYLVNDKLLQRKIINTYYLTKDWSNHLRESIIIGKEYTWSDIDQMDILWKTCNGSELILLLDDRPSKVYFEKYNHDSFMGAYPKKLYTFEIDYNSIKSENEISQQELAEYIFHPDRVRRFGVELLDN
jgi:hypothetical protein